MVWLVGIDQFFFLYYHTRETSIAASINDGKIRMQAIFYVFDIFLYSNVLLDLQMPFSDIDDIDVLSTLF